MNKIIISDITDVITTVEKSRQILNGIRELLSKFNDIIIDMSGIQVMTTNCANIIFGSLYVELGANNFYSKISFINATDDLKIIIQEGIASSLKKQPEYVAL